MMTRHKTVEVDGVSVFYREAGEPASPKLVLLGGFPASSHQFRDLIPALSDRFHVVSPDYPGFGNTVVPEGFVYTFDRISQVVEGWLLQIGFTKFGLYPQDYGGRSAIASSDVTRSGWLGRSCRTPTPTRRASRTLILWGQNDLFFTAEGGEGYLRDLPDAEMHRLDSGHFAVEDKREQIVEAIVRLYDQKVAPTAAQPTANCSEDR